MENIKHKDKTQRLCTSPALSDLACQYQIQDLKEWMTNQRQTDVQNTKCYLFMEFVSNNNVLEINT